MGNPLFNFLHDTQSPDHTYYRWRTYSLAQGDDLQQFRTAPFQMYENGAMWQPPACPIVQPHAQEGARSFSETGSTAGAKPDTDQRSGPSQQPQEVCRNRDESDRIEQSSRERDIDGRGRIVDGQLSAFQLETLHELLRSLSTQRKSIEEGLMFCIDHSEAAKEIVSAE